MRIEDVRQRLRSAGAGARHETLALRAWVRGLPLDAFAKKGNTAFPKSLIAELPAIQTELASLATVRSEHAGADDSARFVLELRRPDDRERAAAE